MTPPRSARSNRSRIWGSAPPGDGGAFSESGATTIGGSKPVNPSGGLESKGHPLAATGLGQIHELVTQLRGEAGPRQVDGARWAIAENGGGLYGIEEAAACVSILHRDRATAEGARPARSAYPRRLLGPALELDRRWVRPGSEERAEFGDLELQIQPCLGRHLPAEPSAIRTGRGDDVRLVRRSREHRPVVPLGRDEGSGLAEDEQGQVVQTDVGGIEDAEGDDPGAAACLRREWSRSPRRASAHPAGWGDHMWSRSEPAGSIVPPARPARTSTRACGSGGATPRPDGGSRRPSSAGGARSPGPSGPRSASTLRCSSSSV